MNISALPTFFAAVWANAASSPYINTIPTASQEGVKAGAASLADGFPSLCFVPFASGGAGPFGSDFNGILAQVTAGLQWVQAGGPMTYSGTYSTTIGGYPNGAIIQSAVTPGLFWRSTTDNNTSNPDTGGANWVRNPAGSTLAHGQCLLGRVSNTQYGLTAKNGNNIISGGAQYHVASGAGVLITGNNNTATINGTVNQSVANSTAYYVSYNGAAGQLRLWSFGTLNYSTGVFTASGSYSHGPDTTTGNVGIEVITSSGTPQTNETLVGMIITDSSGNFQASGGGIQPTLNWFNRNTVYAASASATTASSGATSLTEISASARVIVLVWGATEITVSASGSASVNSTTVTIGTAVSLDGAAIASAVEILSPALNANVNISHSEGVNSTEGVHVASLFGQSSSGATVTWSNFGIFVSNFG